MRANGTAVLKNLTNPNEATAVVPAGTVKADVTLAGTSTVAIGPADLPLKEGANTVVYAWGSATDKNLQLPSRRSAAWTPPPVGSTPAPVARPPRTPT